MCTCLCYDFNISKEDGLRPPLFLHQSVLALVSDMSEICTTVCVCVCVCVLSHLSSMLHSRVLGEQTQLKEEMEALRRENSQLVREHNHLKQSYEELQRLHGEDQKEVADLRLQQQQVWISFGGHFVNTSKTHYIYIDLGEEVSMCWLSLVVDQEKMLVCASCGRRLREEVSMC